MCYSRTDGGRRIFLSARPSRLHRKRTAGVSPACRAIGPRLGAGGPGLASALAEFVEGDDLGRGLLLRRFFGLGRRGASGRWQAADRLRLRWRPGEFEREIDRRIGKAADCGERDGQALELLLKT